MIDFLASLSITLRRAYEPIWRFYRIVRACVLPPRTFKIKQFRIEAVTHCNAKCIFCIYPLIAKERGRNTMSWEVFERACELVKQTHQTEVDLTPVVGDPLLDEDLERRVHNISIRWSVRFTTNLIALNWHKHWIHRFRDKLTIRVSTAPDRDTYLRLFNVDAFDTVSDNISWLQANNINSIVQLRHDNPPIHTIDVRIWSSRSRIEWTALWENWNNRVSRPDLWTGYMRRGLYWNPIIRRPCENMRSPLIHHDGTVSACNCRPVGNDIKIGTVNDDIHTLESKANELRLMFVKGSPPQTCRQCSFYCPE